MNVEWYVRDAANSGELDASTAHAACRCYWTAWPEPQRSHAQRVFVEMIRVAYNATGRPVLGWLQ
jgi:hypothetical protein